MVTLLAACGLVEPISTSTTSSSTTSTSAGLRCGPGVFDDPGCVTSTTHYLDGFDEWLSTSTTATGHPTTTRPRLVELLAEEDYLEDVADLEATLDDLEIGSRQWEDRLVGWGRGLCSDLDTARSRESWLQQRLDIEDDEIARLTAGVIELAIVHLCPHHQDLLSD